MLRRCIALALFASALLLAACGQKGDLYLPLDASETLIQLPSENHGPLSIS